MEEHTTTERDADPKGEAYTGCFARACKHLVNKQCDLYTTARPPIIVIDGRCMGFETG